MKVITLTILAVLLTLCSAKQHNLSLKWALPSGKTLKTRPLTLHVGDKITLSKECSKSAKPHTAAVWLNPLYDTTTFKGHYVVTKKYGMTCKEHRFIASAPGATTITFSKCIPESDKRHTGDVEKDCAFILAPARVLPSRELPAFVKQHNNGGVVHHFTRWLTHWFTTLPDES